MTPRPRVRIIVATAAVLAGAIAAVAVVEARDGSSPSSFVPGHEAQAALAVLAAPSTPGPLPGSTAAAGAAYRYAAGCEAMRVAYQQPDAPVPPGATVTVAADGGLRVTAQFGPSAVFASDLADGSCDYEIHTSPTVVVTGPDVPNVNDFLTVSCFEPLGIALIAIAEVDVDGQPHTIVFAQNEPVTTPPQPQPFTLSWFIGLPADVVQGGSQQPGSQSFEGLTGTYDAGTRSATVSGPGPTGPITISFQCTPSNLTVAGF